MPTSTYDLIASNVLGSSAASVTFSSISASYRDLVLIVNRLSSGNFTSLVFNSDTGSNYIRIVVEAYPSTIQTSTGTYSQFYPGVNVGDVLAIFQIFDYAQTDKHKSILTQLNDDGELNISAGRWASTSAITSITANGGFDTGDSLYLYGIVG